MPKVGEPNPNGIRLKPQQQKFLDNYLHKDGEGGEGEEVA
jgi:hypothetical protein